jgi:hypothetical protein
MRFHHVTIKSVLAAAAVAAVVSVSALALESPNGGSPASPNTDRSAGHTLPPRTAAWSYQLQGKLRMTGARVYDVDGFDAPSSFVARLRRHHRYAICYVDAGTWENWRPDRGRFPESVLGRPNGWPGERWLDVRRLNVLLPIMHARFERCRRKGFHAVEPDNVDGYANETGFPLSARDQLTFNRRLAALAHELGLAVALKNDLDQVHLLRRDFDFAVVEQCVEFAECRKLRPFTRARKPVFGVEYSLPRASFCKRAKKLGINAISATIELDGPGQPCR